VSDSRQAGRVPGDRINESFRLTCEALGTGVAYSSERIVDRARRFRREYAGPASSYFDDQIRSALLLDSAHVKPPAALPPHRPGQGR